MEFQLDYIIVGQGLAGSCLALELLKRKKKIIVFDEAEKNRASMIAAGLFNPVTGKMMTRTWKAHDLFSSLPSFYGEAAQAIGKSFFHHLPLYRPFISIEEQNEWMAKSAEPGMMDYIEKVFAQPAFAHEINDPFGGLLLKNCGYIDTAMFLSGVKELLMKTGSFEPGHFKEEDVLFSNGGVSYKGILASKIIYTGGLGTPQSLFLKEVPLRALKGETLLIKAKLTVDRIYNRGVYIVPTSHEGVYKVGATYNTKDKKEGTTMEGRAELVEKLGQLLRIPYEIVGHDWGFRPTTPDRRPILGAHPNNPNLVIFNGLGTKGVSMAPYFALQLADWLDGKKEIEQTVRWSRFY